MAVCCLLASLRGSVVPTRDRCSDLLLAFGTSRSGHGGSCRSARIETASAVTRCVGIRVGPHSTASDHDWLKGGGDVHGFISRPIYRPDRCSLPSVSEGGERAAFHPAAPRPTQCRAVRAPYRGQTCHAKYALKRPFSGDAARTEILVTNRLLSLTDDAAK